MTNITSNDMAGGEKMDSYEEGQWEIDKSKEKKLVRKLDAHIVPVVMLVHIPHQCDHGELTDPLPALPTFLPR